MLQNRENKKMAFRKKNVQIEAIYIKLELEGWLTFDGGNSDRKGNISNSERLTSVITKS